MIINLTQHAINLYDAAAPDVFDAASGFMPVRRIPASGTVARVAERVISTRVVAGAEDVPGGVTHVAYGETSGLPDPRPATFYVVSLPLALANLRRRDLLVPWRQVRDVRGTVIGCRGLARPC